MTATQITIHNATPAKLRDGSWGVRFTSQSERPVLEMWASESEPVLMTVTTRAGKSWTARLGEVLSVRKSRTKAGYYDALCRSLPYREPQQESQPRQAKTVSPQRKSRAHTAPVYAEDGFCGCGELGRLYGRYAPGMCGECWSERYG